tara:strand:+ start:3583 stop:3918 length:336 start_codon:yes stop_codon:yes gene_type:complete
MKVGRIFLLVGGLLSFGLCSAQISVMHFNSKWNNDNAFDVSSLKDCETKDVVICDNPELKDKFNIISVPTIIIFDEKEEITRFEANIMLQLSCTLKDLQKQVDKIMIKRFE